MPDESERGPVTSESSGLPKWAYLVIGVLIMLPILWIVSRSSKQTSAPPATAQDATAPAPAPNYPPEFVKATNDGLAFNNNHDFAKAEASFREALKYEPNSALALNNLGSVLNEEGKFDEAIPLLEKAVASDPTFALARNNLAWANGEKAKGK